MTRDSERLIDAYLDGDLTSESAAALEAWLREDPEHVETFVRESHLHRELRDLLCGQASQSAVTDTGVRPASSGRAADVPLGFLTDAWRQGCDYLSNRTPLSLLVAAMAMGSILTLMALCAAPLYRHHNLPRPEPLAQSPYVARLTRTSACRWVDPAWAPMPGAYLQAGREIKLVEGLTEIEFKCGARVILEGPATFHLESENAGRLDAGRLIAQVPEKARGFGITTPVMEIVDWGTRFGVHVAETIPTEVHVFQGTVDIAVDKGGDRRPLRLAAGQAVTTRLAEESGEVVLVELPARPEKFEPALKMANHPSGAGEFSPEPVWIEGEAYFRQTGSDGPDRPTFASGKMCLGSEWGRRKNHFVIYRLRVDQAWEDATVHFRYARRPESDSVFDVFLDGQRIAEPLVFKSTGGWGHLRDDEWAYHAFHLGALPQGQHELKLVSTAHENNTNIDGFFLAGPSFRPPTGKPGSP